MELAEAVGPTEFYDPVVRKELKRAAVWIGMITLTCGVIFLAQPILLIIGALVLAAMMDGGARLLGRILPIGRGWRLAIIILSSFAALAWLISFAGSELAAQASQLQIVLQEQIKLIGLEAETRGFTVTAADINELGDNVLASIGRVTEAVTSAVGVIAGLAMMFVLAIFIAAEPRIYERGLAWMLPLSEREQFYGTMDEIGFTLRRLMAGRLIGMFVEGVGTWLLLMAGGVPMAALLGILTGLLAFLPNIGAIVSGVLITLVGFSAGWETGLFAIGVYIFVQTVDGYLIVPMIAKKAVDLAPALVLGAQIIMGALFGILGLALADPIIAMIKVSLERHSERIERRQEELMKEAAEKMMPNDAP
ncbi:AI-2E family transporter [Sphingorhabdus lutea]|uniref:AI-2E family transporter n=1 Tax=Sphingorhabdus lutea TaxID=1913578 RepID=A0A1L3JEK0_9SPHN|nr:AI-2E family transporter [Sphingorhabdus lutea]APG63546.1 AI-2E family transporter [Sphingorhabdus lutea]